MKQLILAAALILGAVAASPTPSPAPSATVVPVAKFPSSANAPIACPTLADGAKVGSQVVSAETLGAVFAESLKERGLVTGRPDKAIVIKSLNDILNCFGG